MREIIRKYKSQFLTAVLFIVCVGCSIYVCTAFTVPWWQESRDVQEQVQVAIETGNRLEQFAYRNKNFEEQFIKKQKQIETLEKQLPFQFREEELVDYLQQRAVINNVVLTEVQPNAEKELGCDKDVQTVKISAKGQFSAMMNWIRDIDEKHLPLNGFELSSEDKSGNVRLTTIVKNTLL